MPALDGYTETAFTFEGKTRRVFRRGSGPAVLIISEIPGITPLVADFGRRVDEAGFTAVLPSLFGDAGQRDVGRATSPSRWRGRCVSKEFSTWARNKTSPATHWCKALARHEHEQCGGPGVGVVGMCLTGNFALAMMVDPVVAAPVLSQPSLPFVLRRRHKRDLNLSPEDLAAVKARCEAEDDLCVLGLRFTGDPWRRRTASPGCARSSATRSSASRSTRPRATRTASAARPTRCSPRTWSTSPATPPRTRSTRCWTCSAPACAARLSAVGPASDRPGRPTCAAVVVVVEVDSDVGVGRAAVGSATVLEPGGGSCRGAASVIEADGIGGRSGSSCASPAASSASAVSAAPSVLAGLLVPDADARRSRRPPGPGRAPRPAGAGGPADRA